MQPVIRKLTVIVEEVYSDGHKELAVPLRVAAGCAVIKNPFAGRHEPDLTELNSSYSLALGELLTDKALRALDSRPVVFGKAVLVGEAGDVEHGSAIIHTGPFGDFLRVATEGDARVPAAEKRGGVGDTIDLSMTSAFLSGPVTGTPFKFSWEVRIPDAPHADEILVVAALADGGRANSRRAG